MRRQHRWLPFDRRGVLTPKTSAAASLGWIRFVVRCADCRRHFTAQFYWADKTIAVADKGRPCPFGRVGR